MDKDLIVGMATGYGWEELAPFVNSLKMSGCNARVILICEQPIPGVETVPPPPLKEHPFRARHIPLANLITDEYRFVLSVDTRDVIFQLDPMNWLEKHIGQNNLVVASEGLTFRSCPGFEERIRDYFPGDYHGMLDKEIISMGVVGGRPWAVRELLLETHRLCEGVPGDDDQTAMNVLIRRNPKGVRVCTSGEGWVCNFNQTGAREIRNGVVYPLGCVTPYAIWHQWQYWGEYGAKYEVLPTVHHG